MGEGTTGRASKPGGGRPPNILLVTVDCLRRDRLSAYGYERRTTPFLDSLLDRSLHCTSAHSAASWTCPSVASMLTGLYPHRHGGGIVPGEFKNLSKQNLPTTLPSRIPSLASVLGSRGYATAAIAAVWNAHLSVPGLFQEMVMLQKPAPKLVRRSLEWIRSVAPDGPFFLWLHLGDTHEPLDVPRSLRGVFGPVPRVRNVRRWDFTTSDADVASPEFHRYRDARVRLYDASVRAADAAMEALLDGLRALGEADRTVGVITSDHGEEFWEHRQEEIEAFTDPRDIYGTGHGHNLFQVHLLVPLILFGAGIPVGAIEENVSLVDIPPTVLHALGEGMPTALGEGMAAADGRSLLEPAGPRPILAEGIAYGFEKRSVVLEDVKLLVSPGDGVERAFRLGPDREELGALEDPAQIDRLRALLPAGAGAAPLGEQVEATEEIVEHLRDLGYIE